MKNEEAIVTFELLFPDAILPNRATAEAAGYDVYVYLKGRTVEVVVDTEVAQLEISEDRLILQPGARAAIPLGFRAKLPSGIEAQIRLRSSIAFWKGLFMPNAPATIDPDYPGEWLVLVANGLSEPVSIDHHERLAQIVFSRFEVIEWRPGHVAVSSGRIGGLGSTGK